MLKPQGAAGLGIIVGALIPHACEYLAGMIEKHVEKVEILDRDFQHFSDKWYIKYLKKFKPDLIGISIEATEHNDGLRLARLSKKIFPDVKIFVGGFQPTALPEAFLKKKYIDAIVNVANRVRDAFFSGELANPFSTRRCIQWGMAAVECKDLVAAAEQTFLPKLPSEEAEVVKQLIVMPFK